MERETLGERPLLEEKRLSPRPPLPKSGWEAACAFLWSCAPMRGGRGFLRVVCGHGG